jgi:hypothetical protein
VEIVELFSVPANSLAVKTLYEVFSWGREATAEYLYHGEIDINAVKADGTGDLTIAEYYASVEVSFESDVIDVNNTSIIESANWEPAPPFDTIESLTPAEMVKLHGSARSPLLIESSSTSCFSLSILNFNNACILSRIKVDEGRNKEVRVFGKGSSISLGAMLARANWLSDHYKNIPQNKFTGAIRE